MNQILDTDLNVIGAAVLSFIKRPAHRHVINTLLDGTIDVEVIGSASLQAAVKLEATWDQQDTIDAGVQTGATFYIDWEGVRYAGVFLSDAGITWARAFKGPAGYRRNAAELKFAITSQAAL